MELNTVARDVLALIQAEGVSLSDDLSEVEQVVREAVLRIGARAVELHLAGKPLGYDRSSRACEREGCGHDQKFMGHRPRTLATLMGQVTIKRAYYHCKHCGASCCPYDRQVGLGSGHESVGLAKAASLLAAVDPFVPAAMLLRELTGQRLGDRTIHRMARRVGRVGRVASEQERELALKMAAWSVPVEGVEAIEARPARLYVAVDGVMVRREQWNEAKCVTCYWEVPDGRGGVIRHGRYAVRFESAEQFKAFVWSLAMRCGLDTATEVVLLGDGAAWIWEQVAGVLGERTICVTDWYHVMEHVWACGNALHGEGTDAAEQWVKGRETLLWEGRYPELIEQLDRQRRQTRSLPKHRALAGLAAYLRNQAQRLAYAEFRARGMDIGSGRVESACKHVVASRMKRSGMLWSDTGAQEILSLRTAYLNGWWDRLWANKPLLLDRAA
jgi:Uncharacterised protein family (UPF0236)